MATTASERLCTLDALYELGPQNFYFSACVDGVAWFESRGCTRDGEPPLSDLVAAELTNGVAGFPRRVLYGLRSPHAPPVWTNEGLVVAADHKLWLFDGFEDDPIVLRFPGFEFVSADCPLAADSCGRLAFAVKRVRAKGDDGSEEGNPSNYPHTQLVVVLDPRPLRSQIRDGVSSSSGGTSDGEFSSDRTQLTSSAALGRFYPISVASTSSTTGRAAAKNRNKKWRTTSFVPLRAPSDFCFDLNLDVLPYLPETQLLWCFEFGPHESIDSLDLTCPLPANASPAQKQAVSASNTMFNWRALAVVREPDLHRARLAVFENAYASSTFDYEQLQLQGESYFLKSAAFERTLVRENLDLFGSRNAYKTNGGSSELCGPDARGPPAPSVAHANVKQEKLCLHWCEYARPVAKWLGGGKIAIQMTVDGRHGMYTVAVFPLYFSEVKWRTTGCHLLAGGAEHLQGHQAAIANGGNVASCNKSLLTSLPLYEQTVARALSSAANPWNMLYKTAVPECFGEFDGNDFAVYQDATSGAWHAILSRPGTAGAPPNKHNNAQQESSLCADDSRFFDELWTLNFDRNLTIRLPGTKHLRGSLVPLFAEPAAADNANSPVNSAGGAAAPLGASPKRRMSSGNVSPITPGHLVGNIAAANAASQAGAIYVFHSSPQESGDVYYVCNSLNPDAVNYVPTYRVTYTGRRLACVPPPRCLSIPSSREGGERIPCVVYLPETVKYMKEGAANDGTGSSPSKSSPSKSSRSRKAKREYPVLVWLHGGPNSHCRLDWIPTSPNPLGFMASTKRPWGPVHLGPWLASQHGFIVVMPNFAGGTRYGLSRLKNGWGAGRFGVNDVADVLDVGRFLRTRQAAVDLFGDGGVSEQGFTKAIGLGGRSCGGLLTLLCLQKQQEGVSMGSYTAGGEGNAKMAVRDGNFHAYPSVYQCGIAFCPITDWTISQQHSRDARDVTLLSGFVGENPHARENAKRISPALIIGGGGEISSSSSTSCENQLKAPLLMMHGEEDELVVFENCLRYEELVLKKCKGGYRSFRFVQRNGGELVPEALCVGAGKGGGAGGAGDAAGRSSQSQRQAFVVGNSLTPTDEGMSTLIKVEGEDHTLVSTAAWREQIPELLLQHLHTHLLPWQFPNNPAPCWT